MGTQLFLPKKGVQPLQFSAHFYCGQTAGCIKMPLVMEVGLSPGHFVVDGTWEPSSLPKKWGGHSPTNFWPMSIVAKRLDGSRCHLVRRLTLPQPHCVRWGPSSLSHKRGRSPQFSAHICFGQMAGWIKMPLGREVGLGPRDIVLDGDPAPPPQKGAEPPVFGPCLLWPNGWMDQDGT